jgi:hypothetical protein
VALEVYCQRSQRLLLSMPCSDEWKGGGDRERERLSFCLSAANDSVRCWLYIQHTHLRLAKQQLQLVAVEGVGVGGHDSRIVV